MYQIGEALIGNGNEIAHVDLVIGDKNGPVGAAFVNNMADMSIGHTPLLSVIRPNLLTKPATLIVPKVTVRDLEDADKILVLTYNLTKVDNRLNKLINQLNNLDKPYVMLSCRNPYDILYVAEPPRLNHEIKN